jgi:hypothetical protein
MNRMRVLFVVFVVLALTISVAVAQRPGGGPPGQDKDKDAQKSAVEPAVFGAPPVGTADIWSDGPVLVGTDVQTYSPEEIVLYLSEDLVGDNLAGSHGGMARVLRKNAREGGRLDFYFDCVTNDLNSCAYRLIVRFGIHDKKTDTVWFDPGTMELYLRPQEDTPGELLKGGQASFSVAFE